MIGLLGVSSAGLAAVISGSSYFLDVAVAVCFVGFLTTVAFSAFVERGTVTRDRP